MDVFYLMVIKLGMELNLVFVLCFVDICFRELFGNFVLIF